MPTCSSRRLSLSLEPRVFSGGGSPSAWTLVAVLDGVLTLNQANRSPLTPMPITVQVKRRSASDPN